MADTKVIFLTGATGLVGSYLLKVLLNEGCKVYTLARSKDGKATRDRITDILKFWDEALISGSGNNFSILDGDITENNLGLDEYNIDLLKDEIEEIYHCAAVTQFNWPLEKIRKINVEGTRNILKLAVKCREQGRLKKVNHVSTAYVCGDYKGVFKEDDLDVGQSFHSTYEQSKFEAEKLVGEYRQQGLWIDIFRPPLVLGESATGKTTTFQQSPYQLLHMCNLELFESLPAKDFHFNVVFTDDLCKALFNISSSTSSANRNWHLFNCNTVSLEEFLGFSSGYVGFAKPALVTRDEFLKINLSPAQKMLLANNISIFNNSVRLDSIRTNKVLREYRFNFSGLDNVSFSNILNFCVKEGFLKKKI